MQLVNTDLVNEMGLKIICSRHGKPADRVVLSAGFIGGMQFE